jgi:hypothetical protein
MAHPTEAHLSPDELAKYHKCVTEVEFLISLALNIDVSMFHDTIDILKAFLDTSDYDIEDKPFTDDTRKAYATALTDLETIYNAVKEFKAKIPVVYKNTDGN